MSALSSKLAKLEDALAPPTDFFSVTWTEVLLRNGLSKFLPVTDGEMARVKAEVYREGIDKLVMVREFVDENDLDVAELGFAR